MKSVVQDWLSELPFKQQATVLCALRGCDGQPKEDPSKPLVRYLRACVLNPADLDWKRNLDSFFSEPPRPIDVKSFWASIDQYPLHFFMHLLHAAEILAYQHPEADVRGFWGDAYLRGARALHLNPESREQFDRRLCRGTGG